MRRVLLFFLSCMFAYASAQTVTVKGVVMAQDEQDPVIENEVK